MDNSNMSNRIVWMDPVDKVKEIHYSPEGPYGPLIEDDLLIDGDEWPTVSDFVKSGKGDLFRGMLYKFCQNIHLQCIFTGAVKLIIDRKDSEIIECFKYLHDQFRHYTDDDLRAILPDKMNLETDDIYLKRVKYFRSCQPFLGRDKAIFISTIYGNKLLHHCTYDPPIESLLRSFLA